MNPSPVFLRGKRLDLRPLLEEDFTPAYLAWLNDSVVNEHSQRRPFPCDGEAMRAYPRFYRDNPAKGFVLAMVDRAAGVHMGNISLVDIELVNRCGNVAILIGETSFWGKGYGAEAIYLVTRHAFAAMNLHKLIAGSFNPAFVRCVEKLGWTREAEFKERIWSQGRFHSQIWLSILQREFTPLAQYEESATS